MLQRIAMINDTQRRACEQVIGAAEEGRRLRGLALLHSSHLLRLTPTENGNVLAEFTYEKFFDLVSHQLCEATYHIAIMADGTTACDCGDSISRRVVCKHAYTVAALLLNEGQSA